MKIIRKGNIKHKKKTEYRFQCSCGCIFHCNEDEIKKLSDHRNDILVLFSCPTCKETVYGKEYVYRQTK